MVRTALLLALALTLATGCGPATTDPDSAAPAERTDTHGETEGLGAIASAPEPPAPEPEPEPPDPRVPGDLLTDGAFEEGITWWETDPADLTAVQDADHPVRPGATAVRIAATASFSLTQHVTETVPGQCYELAGAFRTEDLEGALNIQPVPLSAGVPMEVPAEAPAVTLTAPVSGTQGWSEFSLRTETPPGADGLAVTVTVESEGPTSGLVWLAAFSLLPCESEAGYPAAIQLVNGGFDDETDPAAAWENPDEAPVDADRAIKARAGSQSLRVHLAGRAYAPARLLQWVEAPVPGAVYELTGWLRTDQLPGEVSLAVLTGGDRETAERLACTTGLSETLDWREVGLVFDLPEDADALAVEVGYAPDAGSEEVDPDAPCGFWVDEVSLRLASAPPRDDTSEEPEAP